MTHTRGTAILFVMVVWLSSLVAAEPTAEATQVSDEYFVLYVEPVAAGVIDDFRPPEHFAGPGNRGIEYGTTGHEVVVASARGIVTFAGSVAGRKIVSITHDDGVRTTYSGLNDLWMEEYDFVSQNSVVGIAAPGFHFGARWGQEYLDPQVLIEASLPTVRAVLVPDPGE